MRVRQQLGFTLLEVMIAISIFALVGLATYRMLDTVLQSDQRIKVQELRLRELVRALEVFERDILQLRPRPIRSAYGDELPALSLQGDSNQQILEFTRAGWSNPLAHARSQLQRVRWQYQNDQLTRQYWQVLDQAQDSLAQPQSVLSQQQGWQLQVMDEQGQWHSQWPLADTRSSGGAEAEPKLPKALRLTLQHPHYGELLRQWRLPDGPPQTEPGQAANQDSSQNADQTPSSEATQ
ncbi:type II secretion system minor pseudopilin GspJ [Atopomonas sediminilitoris]|uniref:type II secretion system minor pseudopilin GspJ n=1 Tax=Atopomonas sediminilitoris TaxID=2919919 RepID=UPI001F4EFEFA|nr:type II secretion system minor pseudopilin GspJ [Atopomonas sediminilitoris]MCJ8168775.1 type II secretion system minor pseudopilin GspJ [Atopomonas sediminilitoris]